MSYEKHSFVSGNILYATQLKEMDDQIYDLTTDEDILSTQLTALDERTTTATDEEVEAMLAEILVM